MQFSITKIVSSQGLLCAKTNNWWGYFLHKIQGNIKINILFRNTQQCSKIITKLLGKKIKSKLKPKDFTHLSQELNKATKLLESATKSKQKGVNIFLYGDVGCGKTEFAKLIANSAKTNMHEVITETKDFCEKGATAF